MRAPEINGLSGKIITRKMLLPFVTQFLWSFWHQRERRREKEKERVRTGSRRERKTERKKKERWRHFCFSFLVQSFLPAAVGGLFSLLRRLYFNP